MAEVSIGIAFIAGLVSFISPCVLPLVPAYVGYMGGQVTTQMAAVVGPDNGVAIVHRNRVNTMAHAVFFVLGFTFVFVTFGLLASAGSLALRGSLINIQEILARLGGLLIIAFGLHVMGVMPRLIARVMARTDWMNSGSGYLIAQAAHVLIAVVLAWALVSTVPIVLGVGAYAIWLVLGGALTRPGDFWGNALTRLQTLLYSDTRQQYQPRANSSFMGSAFMGVVFAAGWTPCIGPVYGAVLTLAANGGSLVQAGVLLTAYSLGLGVPFLFTALLLDQAYGVLRRLQRNMRTIELASGVFLIVIGILVLSGQIATLSQLGSGGDFAYDLEECTTALFNGEIRADQFGACMEGGKSSLELPSPVPG